MIFRVQVSTIYNCSLERAFKTPILCDVTKIHTGYGLTPKVTHTTDDIDWGQIGSTKKIHVEKTLLQKGGFASIDRILDRKENIYWKIQVDAFQSWMAGFYKFVGEWKTTELEERKILVEYSYALHANVPIYYPLYWLFAKVFWKIYMKRVLENVREMVYEEEPYLYQ